MMSKAGFGSPGGGSNFSSSTVFEDHLRALHSEYARMQRQCSSLSVENSNLRAHLQKMGNAAADPWYVDPQSEQSLSQTSLSLDSHPHLGFRRIKVTRKKKAPSSPLPQKHGGIEPALNGFGDSSQASPTFEQRIDGLPVDTESPKQVLVVRDTSSSPKVTETSAETKKGKRSDKHGAAEYDQAEMELINIFPELDEDGGGTLSINELRAALEAAEIPQARLAKIIRLADTDNSGVVDQNEWEEVIKSGSLGPEIIKMALALRRKRERDGTLRALPPPRSAWMLHPFSRERIAWDIMMVCLCTYIALVLPFTVAWDALFSKDDLESFQMVDRVLNYMFIADVILNFRTGYVDRSNVLHMKWREVCKNYLTSWFLLDAVSSTPLEDMMPGATEGGMNIQAIKVAKFVKLMKVARFLRPRNINFSEASDTLDDLANSKPVQTLSRRGGVFLGLLLLCHWMACGMKIVDTGMLFDYQDVKGKIGAEYVTAIYWSMTTATTVGYGDITPSSDDERIYTTFCMIIGGFFYGYVIGSIASMVADADLNTAAYYERMDLFYAWLDHHKFPVQIARNLRKFYKQIQAEKSAVDEAEIWGELSPALQKEIGEFIIHPDVRNNPLFDHMGTTSVVSLQAILRKFSVFLNTTVTEEGEVGSGMFIVASGWLSICSKEAGVGTGETAAEPTEDNIKAVSVMTPWHAWASEDGSIRIGPGQSFGEEVLLGFVELYYYTTTVVEKAEVHMIRESDFNDLFGSMPHEIEIMRKNALELNPRLEKCSDDS